MQHSDLLRGLDDVGRLVALATVGLRRTVGRIRLDHQRIRAAAAQPPRAAVAAWVRHRGVHRDEEAELDVALRLLQRAGEVVHHAERVGPRSQRATRRAQGASSSAIAVPGIAAVDDHGQGVALRQREHRLQRLRSAPRRASACERSRGRSRRLPRPSGRRAATRFRARRSCIQARGLVRVKARRGVDALCLRARSRPLRADRGRRRARRRRRHPHPAPAR